MHGKQVLKNKITSAFIDEIHVVAPSLLLDNNTALVDAPGVNDPDVVKFARLSEAIKIANGVIVCVNNHLGNSKSTLSALMDLEVVADFALDVAKHRVAPGKRLMFSFCTEEKGPKHALPAQDDERSILHPQLSQKLEAFVSLDVLYVGVVQLWT